MADLLENWHLLLTDFMQRVQTYYGQTTRLKLDRDSVVTRQSLRVAEWHLYGSSRLGIYKTQDTLRTVDLSLVYQLSNINLAPTQTLSKKEFYSFDSTYTHKRGDKLYEGSNHLGNVLVTFSDKRLVKCLEGSVHYQADVRSATDYAAFHALLDDRQWYSSTDCAFYQYGGSNGQEKDDEIYGTSNSYSAEFWQYDPRLGRRWNVDPVGFVAPGWSGYRVFFNNPFYYLDHSGAYEWHEKEGEPNVLVADKGDDFISLMDFLHKKGIQVNKSQIQKLASMVYGLSIVNFAQKGVQELTENKSEIDLNNVINENDPKYTVDILIDKDFNILKGSYGHTMIRLDNMLFEYYWATPINYLPWSTAEGKYRLDDSRDMFSEFTISLPVSNNQYIELQYLIFEKMKDPMSAPTYGLFYDRCTSVAYKTLEEAGVLKITNTYWNTLTPGRFLKFLKKR